MLDVVTTSIYTYTQYAGGPELEDRTLALKLFAGKHNTKAYPTKEELENFGRRVYGVTQPARILDRIAQAMHCTMDKAKDDPRVPKTLQTQMAQALEAGYGYAK